MAFTGLLGLGLLGFDALVGPLPVAQAAPPKVAAPGAAGHATRPAPSGSREPAITTPGPAGDYLRALHTRLHGRWTEDFVKTVSATHPAEHPLNTPSRQVTLALSIRWDGSVAERTVTRSSGAPEFDRAAMDIVRKGAPYPLPPIDVISDDSYAHVEWTFARDHRACAAGAQVTRVDDPLAVSLPRLILTNRFGEALRRVAQAGDDGTGSGMDRFARLYLGRTAPDPLLDTAAAVALAQSGDRTQVPRLRAALASAATAPLAARGLRKLGVDVCEAVREAATSGTVPARDTALVAMRSLGSSGGDVAACRPSLAAMVANGALPAPLRLQALDTLVAFVPAASARPVIMAAIEDKEPSVRGAALLASVRKGAGRPEMYRLAPLLHDKTLEVRGAASAGMVRAGGDLALEQLYLLGRETDPRPGTWVAAELARMSTRPSAEFLGKMLKKNNPPVQLAAARALATRQDAGARSELEAARRDDRLPREVRAVVASGQVASAPAPSSAAAQTPPGADVAIADGGEAVRHLLKNNQHREAAAWISERLLTLEPRAAIDVLGAWLVRSAHASTTTTPGAPSASPAAAPAAAPAAPAAQPVPAAGSPSPASALAL